MSMRQTHSNVTGELDALAVEEREISRRRRELHDEIDRLYFSAPLDDTQMAELDALEALEQSVSRERRRLHERIDELRQDIGLPRWREHRDLDDAA